MFVIISSAAHAQPDCAACHPRQSAAHAATNHARTLRRATTTEFARAIPDTGIAESRDGFTLHYRALGDSLTVRAGAAEGIIEWIVGAGDQGLTPLVRRGGQWLEHRFSFYTRPGRFDLTLGHAPGASKTAASALGIAQPQATITACLSCHSTAVGAEIVSPGVGCVRCHKPEAGHFARPATNQVTLCASCHRLDGPDDKLAIRFQPLRLVKSQCFIKGQVQCGHCHEPHANAVRANPAYYREKCAACHTSAHARKATDCLPCHMPKSSPAPYLEFTDHRIR